MPDGISRVQARVEQIQALLGEATRTNGEFGAELSRATEDAASADAPGPGHRTPAGTRHRVRPGDRRLAQDRPLSAAAARACVAQPVAPAALEPWIEEAAEATGLSGELISSVIAAESGYQADAVSPTGALGLMQLMPGTARSLGVDDPMDPRQNILGGARYLQQQFQRFGSVQRALAAYNAGPAAVARYGGIPPYAETQNYVRRVLSALRGLINRE